MKKLDKKRLIGAMVVPFDEDGKILLVQYNYPHRRDVDKKWTFAGGIVDLGEDPYEAAKREALEEIGVEVELLDRRPIIGYTHDLILLGYPAKLKSVNIVLDEEELLSYGWYTLDQIKDLDTLSLTLPMCQEAISLRYS